jgi:hypothetical protein
MYYKCAKPSAKWELTGDVASMMLPGGVSFKHVSVSFERVDSEWAGTFEGTADINHVAVHTAAEFSSVDGLKSLDLTGMSSVFWLVYLCSVCVVFVLYLFSICVVFV